jgi:hypothetical protein
MKKNLSFLLIILVVACKNTTDKKSPIASTREQLIGEWNNLSIKIKINSKNNTDSNEVFEVDRPQWEETLKIKPIRTFFYADSTYNSAYYNLKDSLVNNPSGKWWIADGKLIMLRVFPSPDTTAFSLSINKDTASFEALIDWDMDKKKDDNYFGRQIKVTAPKN